MTVISISNFVFVIVLTFLVGTILGISSVFHKLHKRFRIPRSEEIWPQLTIRENPKLNKLVIAGNYDQFRQWVNSHVRYVSKREDLLGYFATDIEIIRTGEWWKNPLITSRDRYLKSLEGRTHPQ